MNTQSLKPSSHSYSTQEIANGIQFVLDALTSLRGAEKCFKIISTNYTQTSPTWVTIQNWVLRFGLYQLTIKKAKRNDWIFILDNTVSLGRRKCLTIVGTTLEHLRVNGYQLTHKGVTTLKLGLMEQCTGKIVDKHLQEVSDKVGVPYQIVSDHGSDIKNGIQLFCKKNPSIICTYDITHKMANLLKNILGKATNWKSFITHAASTRNLVLQTEFAHIAPPKQKTKARYLNVKPLLEWRKDIISYIKDERYKYLSPVYQIDMKILKKHLSLTRKEIKKSKTLSKNIYRGKEIFLSVLCGYLDEKKVASIQDNVLQQMEITKRRFECYFGWVNDLPADEFSSYDEIIGMIEIVETQVKRSGLSPKSILLFKSSSEVTSLKTSGGIEFSKNIVDYLKTETASYTGGTSILGTSDVIESIFGKYKLFNTRGASKDIGKMILSIPAFTSNLTTQLVKESLENIRQIDVHKWIKENIGQSIFSSRNQAFNRGNKKGLEQNKREKFESKPLQI